ncbi:MAG: phosphate ABC transporter ATP-binding protein PstB [Chloroflexota bacterium]
MIGGRNNGRKDWDVKPGLLVRELNLFYGSSHALKNLTMDIHPGKVTALIGPSGCGKTSFLRTINRMNEMIKGCKVTGQITLDGENVLDIDPNLLRRRVGMVFQKPNPFPMSIRDNILYGIEAAKKKVDHEAIVRESMIRASNWDELKDRLKDNAMRLSLGQQQRVCIARCLAIDPEVILMDEPTASLDPTSAAKVEATILAMKEQYTVVIVTHNMQQARRISDYTAFMFLGEIVEFGETEQIFTKPRQKQTADYINGSFG